VAKIVSGPVIPLTDGIFGRTNSPVMALNTTTNDAIIAVSVGTPELAIVDLVHSTVNYFTGVGDGTVQGIGVDSADNVACTTTLTDFSVEFYNLATQTGIVEPIPGAGGEQQSGTDVQFDSVNKLFLILQPICSQGNGSCVEVYDTQGNWVEAITSLSADSTHIAFNPSERTGFIQSSNTELESFAY
jgi:hypothetical protein